MLFHVWLPQGHRRDCSGGWADLNSGFFLPTHSLCLLPKNREPLCSKRGSADELPTCYSTRDSFWSAELKWIFKMKVTNGLLWNALVHEIRLWARLGINSRDALNLAQTTGFHRHRGQLILRIIFSMFKGHLFSSLSPNKNLVTCEESDLDPHFHFLPDL